MNSKKRILLGYLTSIYSMTLIFVLLNNFSGRTAEQWRFFYAFTQQSNILVLIWLILFSVSSFMNPGKLDKFVRNRLLMISLTVYISITYFIVAFILNPVYAGQFNPLSSGSELWLHHLTPFVVWILFFLVPSTGNASIKGSLLSLVYPAVYLIFNLIIGASMTYLDGAKAYAYGFINPNTYDGYLVLSVVILGLLIVFSLATMGMRKLKIFIDHSYHEIG